MHRLARQQKPPESETTARKTRMGAIVDDYLSKAWQGLSDSWSRQAKIFLHTQLNPITAIYTEEQSLQTFLTRTRPQSKGDTVESQLVWHPDCQNTATPYEQLSSSIEVANYESFTGL
ncbi:MAG: hypothetical protein JW732_05685 [Dehalococcoidia bacterium]|nr:hypothetical protein [Dehalococcoidia bacterium]